MKKFSRVYIEISNICNLQCSFCPEVEREKKIMPFSLFSSLIDQLVELTNEVTFHLMGEPLTHPDFALFLQYCQNKQMPVNLTTNGTLLFKAGRYSQILNSSVRQINFSLQSFADNFPQKDINAYIGSLIDFTEIARRERPDLYINFRLWNKGTKDDTVNHNRQFLLPLERAFGVSLTNEVDVAFRKSTKIVDRIYVHFDSRFEWPSLQNKSNFSRGFCYGLSSHFGIHADGTVVPCCLDKEATISLGRVDSAVTVLEILNSERSANMRLGFEQFRLVEDLCRKCSFIRRFDSKLNNENTIDLVYKTK